MTWKATQTFTMKATAKGFTFDNILRQDLETDPIEILEFSPKHLIFRTPKGVIDFGVEGTPPNAQLMRYEGEKHDTLAPRIATFEMTAYNKDGHFLKDHPTPEELKTVAKIRFDVGIHDEKEDPKYLINDKSHGIDLDGDASNGVAHIFSKTIEISVRQ